MVENKTMPAPDQAPLFSPKGEDLVKAQALVKAMSENGLDITLDQAVLMANMRSFVDAAIAEHPRELESKLTREIFGGKTGKSLAMLAVMAEFIIAAHHGYGDINLLTLRYTDALVGVLANVKPPRPKFAHKVQR